jgi:hypothetical protein
VAPAFSLSVDHKIIEYFCIYIYTSISMRNYVFPQEVVEEYGSWT